MMIYMCLYKEDIFVISLIVNSFTCKQSMSNNRDALGYGLQTMTTKPMTLLFYWLAYIMLQ